MVTQIASAVYLGSIANVEEDLSRFYTLSNQVPKFLQRLNFVGVEKREFDGCRMCFVPPLGKGPHRSTSVAKLSPQL